MSYKIHRFETISRHQSKLIQPPSSISSLVAVLNYIKAVLEDDQTQTLFQMIGHHMNTHDTTAHHLNIKMLSPTILATIYQSFVDNGRYGGERIEFIPWLLSNPEIYGVVNHYAPSGEITTEEAVFGGLYQDLDETGVQVFEHDYDDIVKVFSELPEEYEQFGTALTLRLVTNWFEQHHNDLLLMHEGNLAEYLDRLLATTHPPAYWEIPETYYWSPFAIMGDEAFQKLKTLVLSKLNTNPPSQPVIDFWSHDDTAKQLLPDPTPEEQAELEVFFNSIYSGESDESGIVALEYDMDVLYSTLMIGQEQMIAYLQHLEHYGETSATYIRRKYLNYYTDHLDFVISDGMSPEYQATMTSLRENVNLTYTKAYYLHTIINRFQGYSLNVEGTIDKLTEERTLDLFNVTGLRKSIVALSLVPYDDNGVIKNRVVVSFDNYNPEFTETLIGGLDGSRPVRFRMVVSLSRTRLEAYLAVDDHYQTVGYDNVGRRYDVDPYFLFLAPVVGHWEPGTIRLHTMRLFGRALDEEGAHVTIAGFRQR